MEQLSGHVNVPLEFSLEAAKEYENIFQQVEVDLIVSGPGGYLRKVPAFWAGDQVFRVRFAAPQPGEYSWNSECSDPADRGLHGKEGKLQIAPYRGDNPLFRSGRLRVSQDKRHFEHSDGTPFLWLADTWWMGLATRLKWPDLFQSLALDRKEKGFSVIMMAYGPFCDFCATTETWHPQQANEGGWPWLEGWKSINPRFYDRADLKFRFLIDQGLMPCIFSMWGFYLPFMGTDNAKRHWRYLVARYGAYPVVYCLSGETRMPTYAYHADLQSKENRRLEQRAEWTKVARYLKEVDPYGNLLTTHMDWHATVFQQLEEPQLLDFQMLQTGHSGYFSIYSSLQELQAAQANGLNLPTMLGEACYEGIMGGSHEEIQRFLFYSDLLLCGCGHAYGASGIWEMHSRAEPFAGRKHWVWGDTYLEEAMHLPGSLQVGLGRKFLMKYPWWRFQPLGQLPDPSEKKGIIGAGIPGVVHVYYLPSGCTYPDSMLYSGKDWSQSNWSHPGAVPLKQGRPYVAHFFDPRTGGRQEIKQVEISSSGEWMPPARPTMSDWVLVIEDPEVLAAMNPR